MTRLDQHVGAVRTRMTLSVWLRAAAWAGILLATIVWIALVVDRLAQIHLPHQMTWFWSGMIVAGLSSIAYAIWRRPSAQQAAVAIDRQLLLKEKFSTALYVRTSQDPFALAAVRDAEESAGKVSLHRQFPIKAPRAGIATIGAVLAVFLTAWLLPAFDFFGVKAAQLHKTEVAKTDQKQAREAIHHALLDIDSAPKGVAERPEIQLAKRELLALRGSPTLDPETARGTAQKAMDSIQKAIQEKIEENKQYAKNQEMLQDFKNIMPPTDETGPMADAQRAVAGGNLDKAVDDLSKAVNSFDKMDKKDQQKAAKQAEQMATALKKMADDPKVMDQVKKQLQQMGATQQQAQQMQNLMQQAAAGNPQAAQQAQQMAKQLAQQANQSGKQSAQQQRQLAQQMQNAMQQMQQKVNTQMNAQQLCQAAGLLAAAMQQASAQSSGAGQPKQGNGSQQANAQPGNQPGQKQGNQPNPQQGNGKQQMANASKQMQAQLQQMQAMANDAQQVAAGQQNAGDSGDDGNQPGQQGQPGGNKPGQKGNGNGPAWGQGNPNNQPPGQAQANGAGRGMGNNRPNPTEAPFQTTSETDSMQKDDKGRVLASSFVKAGSIKGDAKMELHNVLPPIDKEATDEVGEQRIPRQDQDVVRGYFGNIERDTEQK